MDAALAHLVILSRLEANGSLLKACRGSSSQILCALVDPIESSRDNYVIWLGFLSKLTPLACGMIAEYPRLGIV